MTDPFADLERELLAAHARRTAPRRALRAAPRVLAVAATAVAAVLGVMWLGGQSDTEQAASPTPLPVRTDCGEPWSPPVNEDQLPPELASRLSVLVSGEPAESDARNPHVLVSQATRIYGRPVRLPAVDEYAVSAFGAAIVPRALASKRPSNACEAPEGPTEAGVCLTLRDREGGGLGACFTVPELDRGEAFIDTNGQLVGLAPDGVRTAAANGGTSRVERNLFRLSGGARTTVELSPPPQDPGIQPLEGEGCTAHLDVMKDRLPVFRLAVAQDAPVDDIPLPRGQANAFLAEARIVDGPAGSRYVVFPGCGTTVCMWRVGGSDTVCEGIPESARQALVLTHETRVGAQVQIAGVVTEGVRVLRVGDADVHFEDGIFHTTIPADEPATVEMVPAS